MEESICCENTNDYLYLVRVPHFSKVINGKMYKTSTANQLLFVIEKGLEEYKTKHLTLLFQKKTGEYFLFKVAYENKGWNGQYPINKKTIKPLTVKEAKDFVEKNGNCEEYEAIFGAVEE